MMYLFSLISGVNVPTQDFNEEDKWYLQMWTYEAIEDKSVSEKYYTYFYGLQRVH